MPFFKISSDGKRVEEFGEHESSEEHLRTVFENHGLGFIEKNLRFVDRNVSAGHGFIDTLALDESQRPVVIEYKVKEDASPNALVQALSYAFYLQRNQESFAKQISKRLGDVKDDDIDFDNLRLILVAPGFDSHVIEAAQMVEPHVTLVGYKMYKTGEGQALSTTKIYDSTPTRGPVTRGSYTIDWHFSGRYAFMKYTFEKLTSEIKNQLKVEPYYRKEFIAFKRNYVFVDVHVYTDRIEVGLPLPDNVNPSARFSPAPEGRFGSRVTHFTRLQVPKEVDDELMATISEAYQIS